MVNTFVTELSTDYRDSAKNLDIQRLRKQCIEAKQILDILLQLEKIAKNENWISFIAPKLSDRSAEISARSEWVKNTRSRYLKLGYRYVVKDGVVKKYPKDKLPYKLWKTSQWVKEGCYVIVWLGKTKNDHPLSFQVPKDLGYLVEKYPRRTRPVAFHLKDVALPTDEIWSLGFSQHAIVRMWIGYETALKKYINDHVTEYCTNLKKDGTLCSMSIPLYTIEPGYINPWWILYEGVIMSHRASLIRKEKSRGETPWYANKPKFSDVPVKWLEQGYVWAGNIENSVIDLILTGKSVPPCKVCVPITSDSRPKK